LNGAPAALDGIQIVECAHGMAGALPGMILADLGADVVKVEPPGGDPTRLRSAGPAMWDRGKRSIVLDLRHPDEREVLGRLVRRADVALVSLAPRAVAALELGPACIPGGHARLIHCAITGFGDHAVPGGDAAYEPMVAAAIGRLNGLDAITGAAVGQERDRPIYTVAPVASYAAAQLAVQGICAALLDRDVSGRGRAVRTSLLQGQMACFMREELRPGGVGEPSVPEPLQRGIELCFMTAECADGRHIQMCSRQPAHFRNWMTAIGLVDLLDVPRFAGAPTGLATVGDVEELERRIRDRMRGRSVADWMGRFTGGLDIGADPYPPPVEFLPPPQLV
jgi:crotonobetainyl-CoA:carnitine CoA-transferase CaiB-like acyl-CoA transferase